MLQNDLRLPIAGQKAKKENRKSKILNQK